MPPRRESVYARSVKPTDIAVRSQLVAPVLAFVRAHGGDPSSLAERFELPKDAETAPDVTLSVARLRAFLEAAEAEIADPWLGLHVAQDVRRGNWGILEYACRSAPTIREIFLRIVRYSTLFNEHIVFAFEEGPDVGVLSQRLPGYAECVGRHGNEFFVATVLTQARLASGRAIRPVRAFFAHRRPAKDLEPLRTLLGCPVAFGVERNGLELGRATLETEVLTSDPPLLALLDGVAEAALAKRSPAPQRFSSKVKDIVRDALAAGKRPSLRGIAPELRLPARTFQRRLAEEKTTFAELLDSVREDLARAYARDASVPLGAIAFLLGYAEMKPFSRAFRRWTTQSPGAFRAKELKEGKRK